MNLFEAKEKGVDESYIAPDPHFISAISLFSSSFPWERFSKFFKSKKLVNLNGEEQVILLRFLAVQELLCLDDKSLLRWLRNQFYLFNFLQPEFKPRLPTIELLKKFRSELDKIGLLEPFRKQCQHIIEEHGKRFPELDLELSKISMASRSLMPKTETNDLRKSNDNRLVKDQNLELHNVENKADRSCEKCGSHNVIKLESSQEKSSLPEIRFLKCRFCGHTFRD